MKIKIKIIIIGLLVLGICGITIQQSHAYYANTLDYSAGDSTAEIGCNVDVDTYLDSDERSIFGYETVKFVINSRDYNYYYDEGVPFNYTFTIENVNNSSDLLFGYNHVFNDHLTFTGTLDGSAEDEDEYIVQFKSNSYSDDYRSVNYKYTLDCKQDY